MIAMQHPEARRDEFLDVIREMDGKPPRTPRVGQSPPVKRTCWIASFLLGIYGAPGEQRFDWRYLQQYVMHVYSAIPLD